MTFTAQPMRDGRVSVRPTPKTSIPGRLAVTSPSQILMRDHSAGCLICGKPRPSTRALYCDDACKQRAFRLRHGANTGVALTAVPPDLQRRKVLVAHTL